MKDKLQPSILEIYRGNLSLIEERINSFVDPTKIPPDLVRSMIHTKIILEKETINFSNADQLELLDRLESWFREKGLEFPNNAYLDRQRARYSS